MLRTSLNSLKKLKSYMQKDNAKELLRFLTCGSVDDGKSTLIGRLLYDSKAIFEDQLATIRNENRKYGTTGEKLDLALLVDGLQSEREQGITIDVAYRFFTTEKRKFIIADTPGHEQYTRNMVTGASTAQAAVILVDARKGILPQTKRHSYIVHLLGIPTIIVAVNKMDLVDYNRTKFDEICDAYKKEIARFLDIDSLFFVPISALEGDNIVTKSNRMPWYDDNSLLEILETIPTDSMEENKNDFRFPVQYVNRPHADFRGYCGTIASGSVRKGDTVTILPSGITTKIREIVDNRYAPKQKGDFKTIESAHAPMAVTLLTENEVDISRGDMLVHSDNIPRVSNTLKVMIVWMDETPMEPGKTYDIKRGPTLLSGMIAHINYKVDIESFKKIQVDTLQLNDIASCKIVLSRPIAADPYRKNRQTGSFILIDRITNATVGAGMIVDVAKRESDKTPSNVSEKIYTEAEKALNTYIRTHYPEWGCKEI